MQERVVEEYYNPSIETLPRAELKDLQTKLLKEQIKYVFNYSRIERRKFLDAGVGVETVKTLDDLKKVPTITKDEIREDISETNDPYGGTRCIPEEETCGIVELFDEFPPQNDPLYNVFTREDFTNWVEIFARYCTMMGMKKGEGMLIQGVLDPTDSYVFPLHNINPYFSPSVSQIFGGLSLGMAVVMPRMLASGIDGVKAFNWIKFFKSTVLFISPDLLRQIVILAEAEGMSTRDLGVKIIVYPDHEELLKPSNRKEIEEIWGANVFSMICVPMAGFHAIDCRKYNGLHVWEDLFIVETVDAESNEPVSVGETGKLTVTNLFAKGSPLIRYKTSIDVELKEDTCACGRTHIKLLSQTYKEG
ncbi:MAG: phenylacetate--CoA ligase family protein [Candidatus Lokiarchaeia archaeon]